jgi:uncharacterized membrane protein
VSPVLTDVTIWNLTLAAVFLMLTVITLELELTRHRRIEFLVFMWILVLAALLNLNGTIVAIFPEAMDAARFIGAALRAVIILSFAGYVVYRLRHPER